MAKRIQRKRTKGWRMPDGAVYVGRPTKWGNPFSIGGYFTVGNGRGKIGFAWLQALSFEYADSNFALIETAKQAVDYYRRYVTNYPPRDIKELRGKDLACWCALDQPCHADVLLEIANEVQP